MTALSNTAADVLFHLKKAQDAKSDMQKLKAMGADEDIISHYVSKIEHHKSMAKQYNALT